MDLRPSRATIARARGRSALEQGTIAACRWLGLTRSPPPAATELFATTHAQFARVDRTRGCELARIKMERLDADHSGIELSIRLQKFSKRLRRNISATRNGYVWMPGTKLRFETDRERGLLHALVNLKQVRVRLTDPNPDNFRRSVGRKRSDANNGQKESSKLGCVEFFSKGKIGFIRDFTEETERQMHLRRFGPVHAADMRIKSCKQLAR